MQECEPHCNRLAGIPPTSTCTTERLSRAPPDPDAILQIENEHPILGDVDQVEEYRPIGGDGEMPAECGGVDDAVLLALLLADPKSVPRIIGMSSR